MRLVAGLVFFILLVYVLLASNALEFQKKTLEKSDTVERVAMVPSFHKDRLESYVEGRFSEFRSWTSRAMQKVSK